MITKLHLSTIISVLPIYLWGKEVWDKWTQLLLFLLFVHIIPIIILEFVINSIPFVYHEDWKRFVIIGTLVNVFFNFIVYLGISRVFFLRSIIINIKHFISLNCSYQDIAKLASSCVASLLISLIVNAGGKRKPDFGC